MKMVVGLGNPGKKYFDTRHNVGFMVIDNYAGKRELLFKKKFNGLYTIFNFDDEKILLLKPQSFMNLSGEVVKKYCDFFKINYNDIIIIYDDMSFDVGTFKLKKSGSSAGHNGMKNIIDCLHTEDIRRLRIGISKSIENKINYVISPFEISEKEDIKKVINITFDIIQDYLTEPFDLLMNKYNRNDSTI